MIYANRTELTQDLMKKIESNSIGEDEFEFKSYYKNSLYFDKEDPYFCSDCYYLIMVVGKSQT